MVEVASSFQIKQLINIEKAIKDLSTDKVLKVGWVEKNRYPNGMYVAEAAIINEFGAPHRKIPARPFMGPAVDNNKSEWIESVNKNTQKAIKGEMNILDVLNRLGAKAAGDVAKAIKAVTSPPLSPVTIEIRLSKLKNKKITQSLTKPLIDTGVMLRSVTYSVEKE